MPDHAFRIVFQPIVELAAGRTVAYEAFVRPHDGSPPLVWFERGWEEGCGLEREWAAARRTIDLARELPGEVALSLNVSAELIAADPDSLRAMLLDTSRTVWLEVDPFGAVSLAALEGTHASVANVREPGRIEIAVEGVCASSGLALLAPEIVKVSSAHPREALLAAARASGARLCRANCELVEEGTALADRGYELVQGWCYGRPRELRYWLEGGPVTAEAA